MFDAMRRFFAPAPHKPMLPPEQVKEKYPKMRWRVLEATFVGYALYYLVRNNIGVVAKDLETALNYDKSMIGNILAVSAITYGLGKFFMGALSDRSNARVFMAFGLLLTSMVNFAFGATADYNAHLLLWAANGFVQGMGWPPCGRSMGHWYSERERGLTFSIWNTSHNLGGGIAGWLTAWAVTTYGGWQYAFYVPGVITAIGSIYIFVRLVDTPQSVGLPPVEIYKNDMTLHEQEHGLQERELSYKELLLDNVLLNKLVWILALANFFAYITRYSMLDWGPTYLQEIKKTNIEGGGIGVLILEFGGIPSTILLGWLSDKWGGRRGMVAVVSMIPIIVAFGLLPLVPEGMLWVDLLILGIVGLFIYPVINLITIMALDVTGKKAIGTAAGFIGLLGYMGRTVQAKGTGWFLDKFEPTMGHVAAWNAVLYGVMGCGVLALLLLLFTWKLKPKA